MNKKQLAFVSGLAIVAFLLMSMIMAYTYGDTFFVGIQVMFILICITGGITILAVGIYFIYDALED